MRRVRLQVIAAQKERRALEAAALEAEVRLAALRERQAAEAAAEAERGDETGAEPPADDE